MKTKAPGEVAIWGHLALVIVQFCFGLFPIIGKEAFVAFSPRSIVAWRLLVAAGFFVVVALCVHGRKLLLPWRTVLHIQFCSLIGVALNQLFFLEGLRLSTATHAGLLMASIPVMTSLVAILLRREPLLPRRLLGIGIAFSGTVVLIVADGLDFGRDTLRGDLLMFCNVLLYSIYLVLMRNVLQSTSSLVVVAWVFMTSAWTVPLFALDEVFVPADATTGAWLALVAILVFPTIVAYLLNLFALARVGSSTVASYIFLQPVIAACAAWIIYGEAMTPGAWLAGIAILVGLSLVVTRPVVRRVERSGGPSPSSRAP